MMWLHRCGGEGALCCPAEAHTAASVGAPARKRLFTVDLHCHALSLGVEQLVAERPERRAEPEIAIRTLGAESAGHNARVMLPAVFPKLTKADVRLADMAAIGVDLQVVSPSPNQYYYWAEPALADRIVTTLNDEIAALVAAHPGRLLGMGSVALQHPELAVAQLRHAVNDLGLRGVEISSSVNGLELADAAFEPFWAAAAELGCLVFLHPFGTSAADRLDRYYLANVIGQPLETTIALSRLIFGGTFDRHPGLKLLAAHGGGYLPSYFGRSTHAHRVRPEAAQMQHAPLHYLKRIWFDTLVYEPEALRHLIAVVGASQVVVGTDYPFDMGDYGVHALLDAVEGLSEGDRARILGGNAAALLGLSQTEQPNA